MLHVVSAHTHTHTEHCAWCRFATDGGGFLFILARVLVVVLKKQDPVERDVAGVATRKFRNNNQE